MYNNTLNTQTYAHNADIHTVSDKSYVGATFHSFRRFSKNHKGFPINFILSTILSANVPYIIMQKVVFVLVISKTTNTLPTSRYNPMNRETFSSITFIVYSMHTHIQMHTHTYIHAHIHTQHTFIFGHILCTDVWYIVTSDSIIQALTDG